MLYKKKINIFKCAKFKTYFGMKYQAKDHYR